MTRACGHVTAEDLEALDQRVAFLEMQHRMQHRCQDDEQIGHRRSLLVPAYLFGLLLGAYAMRSYRIRD